MRKIFFLLTLFYLIISCKTNAQDLPFDVFNVNNGLPHSDVNAIVQDKRGFIWIATYNGLCRYDGYNTLVYRHQKNDSKCISNNRIVALLAEENFIWIGTETAGFDRFNIKTETFESFKYASSNPSSINSNSILAISRDSKKQLWIGTNKGLSLIKNDQKEFNKVSAVRFLNQETVVRYIFPDGNLLWLGTNDGLIAFDITNYTYKTYHFSPDGQMINGIMKNEDELWLTGSSGLLAFNIKQRTFKKLDNRASFCILKAKSNTIWVGTQGDGLLKFDSSGRLIKKYNSNRIGNEGLSNNEIKALYQDHSGVLWIGTFGGGINMLNLKAKKFITYKKIVGKENTLSSNRVICFYHDNFKNLWIGTRGGGLNVLNRGTGKMHYLKADDGSARTNHISSLYEDRLGGIWIGTWNGLHILKANVKKNFLNERQNPAFSSLALKVDFANLTVFKIVSDKDGYLWLCTSRGLHCYKPGLNFYDGKIVESFQYQENNPLSITDDYITDILIEKTNTNVKSIWIGTKNGLNHISIRGSSRSIRRFYKDKDNGLNENFISFIHQDKKQQIWLGMLGGGIGKIISGKSKGESIKLESYTTKEGLKNDDVETLLEDNFGNFWMGGEGITKFNPINKNFRYYDVKDGLQSNSFKVWAAYKNKSGEMIFGGTNGFNIFHPDSIRENKIAPKIVLTDFKIANKSVTVGQQINGDVILSKALTATHLIELNHLSNNISLEFAALHYSSPENNRYKYILEGFDKGWNTVASDKRFATYTNLKPGDYTFKVIASNSDGVWSNKPVILKIHINKPWWFTHLAILFYLGLAIWGFIILRRYELGRVKGKHNLALERLENKKNAEMMEMKTQFFTSMSHEFRTPLTLIVDPINDLSQKKTYTAEDQAKLQSIKQSTDKLMHLVDQMIDFRKIDKGQLNLAIEPCFINEFIESVKTYFDGFAQKRNVVLTYNPTGNPLVWIDKNRIENVLFNLISNAFKFVSIGGEIIISSQQIADKIMITVLDNGSGITKENLDNIFLEFFREDNKNTKIGSGGIGLSFAKQIIEAHQGEIQVESEENKYTKFTITLLTGNKHFDNEQLLVKSDQDELSHGTKHPERDEEGTINLEVHKRNSNKKVLVVEDTYEVRDYLESQLKQYYRVFTAENGAKGLVLAVKEMPDIIISDIMMPEIDGITLCQRIKTNIKTSHIPVILLTAKSSDEQKIKGYEIGADDYITKPFSSQVLLTRINNIIKTREKLISSFKSEANLSPSEVTITPLDEQLMNKVLALIEENISDEYYSVEKLCSDAAVSRPQLYRKIKALTDMSINEFIRSIRLKRAANLLEQDDASVANVMYQVGFSNRSYFTKTFKEMFDVNPKEYKRSRLL
jgi:signal transduction histidine kinase/ligand-binding sensor domain-containing protein/DNA-binding response OmpR family regulator